MPPGYQLAMVGQGSNCHSKRCTLSFKIRKICFTLCQVPSTQVGLGIGIQYNLHWNNPKKIVETKSTSIFYNLNKYQFLHKNKTQQRVIFYIKHRYMKLFGNGILSFPPEAGY